jgi:hypothetical protein
MRFQKIVEQLDGQLIVFHDQNRILHRKNPLRAADAHAAAFQKGKLRSNSYDQVLDPRHLGFQRYRVALPLHETADCVADLLKANELCSPRIVIAPPGAFERLPLLTGHSRAPKRFRCNCDQRSRRQVSCAACK